MLLRICAASNSYQQVVSENLFVSPQAEYKELTQDSLGNRVIHLRVEPYTNLSVSYNATVELSHNLVTPNKLSQSPIASLPADVCKFLNPSRYCQSDQLAQFALAEFGMSEPGYLRVRQICDWVNNWLIYAPGFTNTTTSAEQVLIQRQGVCRDYAHLAITLCRALGIPARYLSGYAVNLQPPDFHGFFEAYLDGSWYLFDPTKLAPTQGLVRIATGSDAAETSFNTIFGSAFLISMEVSAVEVGASTIDINQAESAVSVI